MDDETTPELDRLVVDEEIQKRAVELEGRELRIRAAVGHR